MSRFVARIRIQEGRLALLSLIALLAACRAPERASQPIEYAIPGLAAAPVRSIALSSSEGSTELENRDGRWQVNGSAPYPADRPSVERLLRILADLEIAKRVQVDSLDRRQLMLDGGEGGTHIKLTHANGERTEIILGSLDFPQDMTAASITGAAALARRFVRVIGEDDFVFLTPTSIADLSTAPASWTERRIFRVPSFRRLLIESASGLRLEYFRERPFGPLYIQGDHGPRRASDGAFKDFEFFLSYGLCEGVETDLQTYADYNERNRRTVIVEDFLGLSYRIELGSPIDPGNDEAQREELQAGIFRNGIASPRVPLMIEVASVAAADEGQIPQSIRTENLMIGGRLANHIVYTNLETCASIMRLAYEP